MGNGFRPLRRNMAWDAGAHDAGIAPLLDRLSFTTGRQRWGCALRFGLLRATPCDMEAIGDVGGGTNMLSFGRFENADVIAAGLA